MILAVDVHYQSYFAWTSGVAFSSWTDASETQIYRSKLCEIEEYVPGQFFRRELPCILRLLEEHNLQPGTIVVDGFVYLDGSSTPGLGKHLYDALGGVTSVIGVAKNRFAGAPNDVMVYRRVSKTPLYVTSVGIPLDEAKEHIRSMHGAFRIPSLLKRADQASRKTNRSNFGNLEGV